MVKVKTAVFQGYKYETCQAYIILIFYIKALNGMRTYNILQQVSIYMQIRFSDRLHATKLHDDINMVAVGAKI